MLIFKLVSDILEAYGGGKKERKDGCKEGRFFI